MSFMSHAESPEKSIRVPQTPETLCDSVSTTPSECWPHRHVCRHAHDRLRKPDIRSETFENVPTKSPQNERGRMLFALDQMWKGGIGTADMRCKSHSGTALSNVSASQSFMLSRRAVEMPSSSGSDASQRTRAPSKISFLADRRHFK